MPGKIPRQFIDDLVARADIIEWIGQRISLKKQGANYSACCPFHQEKTPSFSVNQTKQFYYCFGCGASGNVLSFIMQHDNMAFPEAVEAIAAHLGLDVPTDQAERKQDTGAIKLLACLDEAARFYERQLASHEMRQAPVEYLKKRGITGVVAKQFQLGFAPEGWDNCKKALVDKGYTEQDLVQVGLAIKSEKGRVYDRFRNRLMFPIRNTKGQVLAFGGRVLADEQPKYLNSPETPYFHKGNCLYGVYEDVALRKNDHRLLIVEGYMDVIAVIQVANLPVVATLGTAFTADHARLLFRQSAHLTFCFDGDLAGKKAAWRALEICLPLMMEGRHIEFVFLASGEDPDTFLRANGAEAFMTLLDKSIALGEYLMQEMAKGFDLNLAEGQSAMLAKARPLLNKLPKNLYRQLLVKQFAAKIKMSDKELEQFLQSGQLKAKPAPAKQREERVRPHKRNSRQILPLNERIISLLLQSPSLLTVLEPYRDALLALKATEFELLHQVLMQVRPEMTTAVCLEYWRNSEYAEKLAVLALIDWMLDEQGMQSEIITAAEKLLEQEKQAQVERLIEKVSQEGLGSLSVEEKAMLKGILNLADEQ